MDVVQGLIDEAERRCKKNGSRLTEKRKLTLAVLLKSGRALSAYELIEAYKAEVGDTLPAMSMYRILDFLTGEQLVHKLDLTNKYVACENIGCEHDHPESQLLICSQCQKVKEFSLNGSIMDELKKNLSEAGFRLSSRQIEINCICEDCTAREV